MKTFLLFSLLVLGAATVQAQTNALVPIVPFESKLIYRREVQVYEGERMAPRNIMEREAEYKIVARRITWNRDESHTWYSTNEVATGMFVKKREVRRGDVWVEVGK